MYEKEPDEVKQEVEVHRQMMRSGGSVPLLSKLVDRNKKLQGAIDKLPRTLQLAAESIANQTGWNVSIIAGGPNPRLGGKITTLA